MYLAVNGHSNEAKFFTDVVSDITEWNPDVSDDMLVHKLAEFIASAPGSQERWDSLVQLGALTTCAAVQSCKPAANQLNLFS